MRKLIRLLTILSFTAFPSFASYIVVMKDGATRYVAKAKYTVVNGKALIRLENGQTLQLDPALIDERKSDETTALGLGNAKVLAVEDRSGGPTSPQTRPSLGSITHLRKLPPAPSGDSNTAPAAPVPNGPKVSDEVVRKFAAAYENVGLFEQKITSTGAGSLRVDLTADNEEKVFNAISATSFLMVRDAGVPGTHLDKIELFMRTTNGGSAGRFQMTRADALALDKKTITQPEYFVRNVIY
jgi:hypothetical protein